MYQLENLFNDSTHKSNVFTPAQRAAVEEAAYEKFYKGKLTPFIMCPIRGKEIRLTPEEAVRQMFLRKLIDEYGYSTNQIVVERQIHFGREVKRADIVILEPNRPNVEYIIIEVKKPKLKDGKEQLRSYCNATGATMGVWTNGEKISFYQRKLPNYFEDIPDIPRANQELKDILIERWTFDWLEEKDKLLRENKTLAALIREMEDEVLANSGKDVFEEVFKLIYTKLYDEMMSGRDRNRFLEFRNYGETDARLKNTIQELFDKAQKKWKGIFPLQSKIELMPSHLAICVSSLQNVKLFNSNLDVIDDAFEYLMNKSQKGEKGQFFTPRYVIDMCVRMLNPKINETMIDTAAGSCGFPVHTTFFVWDKILKSKGIKKSHLFSAEPKPIECEEYVNENVFAIDFDEKAVRVAKTLNLIAGDGKTNVICLNTLDYGRWDEVITERDWQKNYNEGWLKLSEFRAVENDNSHFNFDIVMANPPFAGDIKEGAIITRYELGKNAKGSYQGKVGRDILFIERNLNFLKDGGRMAIVLPQGRFNNSSDKYIRDFIAERCRILAVVGLHGNVFKPHTGTKTSVLFVQKWDDELCPRREDYPIFFATMREPSKDNSGDKILETVSEKVGSLTLRKFLRDDNGHTIVKHDLFNHDGKTRDGIAEAFIEFAKREGFSFFDRRSFDALKYRQLSEELECTEILLSEVNEKNRADAEFFQRHYVENENLLLRLPHMLIEEFFKVTDGEHGSVDYLDDGVKYLMAENIRRGFVDISNVKYVSKTVDRKNSRSSVKGGEILISIKGTLGSIAVADDSLVPCNMNRDVAIIKPKFKTGALNFFVAAFMMTSYGFYQSYRGGSGGVQQMITLERLQNFIVPTFSETFYAAIKEIFLAAKDCRARADENYHAAEKLLSEALGLAGFSPSKENVAIKTFSASFGSSGRLDAEFYQPKYDDWKNFMTVAGTVGKLCKIHDRNFLPKPKEIYRYIELANVETNGNISTPDAFVGADLPTRARRIVKAGQVIISSIEGSLQNCALITNENDGALCSTGFFVIDSYNFNSATLLVLFKSELMQNLMRQQCTGTILTAISRENFLSLPLPVVARAVQEKIAAQVSESFRLRGESEKLLSRAKATVELAIEGGEDVAIEFLGAAVK